MNKVLNPLILNTFVRTDFMNGAEIEDSPLVTTKHSVMGGVTVSRVFFKSSKMVTAK